MSQKCSECGRESPLGQPFQHYWGCVHDTSARTPLLSQMGRAQQQAQLDRLQPTSHGADLREALSEYLDAQDALDNWETAGPNRDLHESVMARRSAARFYLDEAMQATSAEVGA